MYVSSFYISRAAQESLTWKQWMQNASAELLHFPILHKHYDEIDVKTLERRRVTLTITPGKLLELTIKVFLAATLVIPVICFAISSPTASENSWRQVDTLFGQLDEEQKKDFLYDFLTKKEIEKSSPFSELHLIAESYRQSSLGADLVSRLISLDPSAFEEVKQWKDASETLYAEANSYVNQHNLQISALYPFLTAADQIRILRQLKTREKDLLKLFSLSAAAALENPGQLLDCLIPIELSPLGYGITLAGIPELFHSERDLQNKIPKAYQAIETLLLKLPQHSVLSIFWKIAKTIKRGKGIWEKDHKVTVRNLSSKEQEAIKALPFEKALILNKFEQPWTELWYRVGQTPESLSQAYFSLTHDNENSYRQEDNRKKFLNFLSHDDLKDLIIEDSDCVELSRIFGNQREVDIRDKTKPQLELKTLVKGLVEIPCALIHWWNLYERVDYKQRFTVLSTFCTNKAFLQYFQARHNGYLTTKPSLDAFRKEWNECIAYAKEQSAQRNYYPSAQSFENWQEAQRKMQKAKNEREQAKQILLSNFKIALEWLGLDSKLTYTQEEIMREFRRWSLTHHPDKDKTEGATERFQQGRNYKEWVTKPQHLSVWNASIP